MTMVIELRGYADAIQIGFHATLRDAIQLKNIFIELQAQYATR